jgi:hypothetical protein
VRGISEGNFVFLKPVITLFKRYLVPIFTRFSLKMGMDTFMDTKDTKYGRFLGIKKGFTVAVNPCFY